MNKPSLDLYIKKGYNMKINSSYKSKNNTLSNNKINQINALTKKIQKKRKNENYSNPKLFSNNITKDKMFKNSYLSGDLSNNIMCLFDHNNIYKKKEKKFLRNSSSNSELRRRNDIINHENLKKDNSFKRNILNNNNSTNDLFNNIKDLKKGNVNYIKEENTVKFFFPNHKNNNKCNYIHLNNIKSNIIQNIDNNNHFNKINFPKKFYEKDPIQKPEHSYTEPKILIDNNYQQKKSIKTIKIKKINPTNESNKIINQFQKGFISLLGTQKKNNNNNKIKQYNHKNNFCENNKSKDNNNEKKNKIFSEKDIFDIILESKNEKNDNFQNNNITFSEIPDEEIDNITPKTIRYNKQIYTNNYIADKFQLLFLENENKKKNKIKKLLLSFLNYNDIYNISQVNKYFYLTTLNIVYNKIINSISNNKNSEKLWLKIYNISKIKINEIDFINSEKKCLNKYKEEINKDVSRTFPEEKIFEKNSENGKKLYNILITYSTINNKIGYSQGINFIAGIIYKKVKNEKLSLIYLDSILTKLNFEKVIGVNNHLINIMNLISDLIQEFSPNFFYYLNKNDISHEMFTANWIITLFSKGYKNLNVLFQIWNFIFIFGWKFIFLFIISIIMFFEKKIQGYDIFQFNIFMKNIFKEEAFINNFHFIVDNTFLLMENKWILTDINSII